MSGITSRQRRANDRRRFLAGYPAWLQRRLGETGCVGRLVADRVAETGHARGVYRVDTDYQRRGRRYRKYSATRSSR
jgi:hypothetical protein